MHMLSFPDRDQSWQSRAYWGTQGGTHSIVAAILNYEPALAGRIEGKATVLSDQQVFASVLYGIENPTLNEREFLGNWDVIADAMEKVADYHEFSEDARIGIRQALRDWVAVDYAGVTRC